MTTDTTPDIEQAMLQVATCYRATDDCRDEHRRDQRLGELGCPLVRAEARRAVLRGQIAVLEDVEEAIRLYGPTALHARLVGLKLAALEVGEASIGPRINKCSCCERVRHLMSCAKCARMFCPVHWDKKAFHDCWEDAE